MANKEIVISKIRQILRFFIQGRSKVYISQQTRARINEVFELICRVGKGFAKKPGTSAGLSISAPLIDERCNNFRFLEIDL